MNTGCPRKRTHGFAHLEVPPDDHFHRLLPHFHLLRIDNYRCQNSLNRRYPIHIYDNDCQSAGVFEEMMAQRFLSCKQWMSNATREMMGFTVIQTEESLLSKSRSACGGRSESITSQKGQIVDTFHYRDSNVTVDRCLMRNTSLCRTAHVCNGPRSWYSIDAFNGLHCCVMFWNGNPPPL
jgi:hypothetical protein